MKKKNLKLLSIAFLFMFFVLPAQSTVKLYDYARICKSSTDFSATINGQDAFVYYSTAGSFVAFDSDETVNVEITARKNIQNARILPSRYGIEPEIDGRTLRFEMPAEAKLLIEVDDLEALFLYSNPLETNVPDPNDKMVKYFKSGQVYEVDELELKDNETVYIEGGAVVRGCVRATSAKNVTVAGRGVLDGGYYKFAGEHKKPILFVDCQESSIRDIILIEPAGWMIELYFSENITLNNVKEIANGHGTDGVDIVNSRKIRILNCMFKNGDDCVVVKSFRRSRYPEPKLNTFEGSEEIEVKGCAFQSNMGGQAFEIGHELVLGEIKNIRFIDCDVLGVHGQGGVFGIHNSDHATVSNVLYENIRVDHFYNKLVDFRVIKSRWSKTEERGHVENVVLRNIKVSVSKYNPGYSISLIGGYDKDHKVKNVVFEDFYLEDTKIENADQLDLYIKQADKIKFK